MADAGNNEQGLRLLGLHVSPFALRARMALSLKGLSYEYIEQDLFHKSELLLASNPVHNKVPVLIHNGKPICESLVVVEYVDEVWPGTAILPADPYGRAVARFWAAYIDGKLFPAYAGVMKAATEDERTEKVRETHAAVLKLEKAFAEISSSGNGAAPFFGGDSVGYLDLALGCSLPWFGALRAMFGVEVIDAARAPLLAAWAERFAETAVAMEVLPEPDQAVAYAKKIQAYRAASAKK
ncbi:probable glutathione S-transferase GSTU6 [Miscanthus floridulus]|uniref:probable glutathione S-transferase GSTU6 n=1 Tax=Miscanthus floridulus TaxID=154761 RepID=UPI003458A24C